MIELDKSSFKKNVLDSKIPVLVDFWAPWCGPCRIVGPILDKIESEYSSKLKFAKLNVDDNQDIAGKHDVRGIPCMIIYSKGGEADRIVGAYPEPELRKKIDLALSKI